MSEPTDRVGTHPGSVLARLTRPRADEPTRFAVLADPHLSTQESGTSKLFEYTGPHLRTAVEDIKGRELDAVLSVGDLTKDGEPWNYDAFDDIIADLEVPFYAVPGNHDVPKAGDDHETIPVEEFAERYAPEGELPYVVEVGDVPIVGVNSSGTADLLYESHDGEVTAEDVAWLDEQLAGLTEPVVLTHFNLPAMSEQLRVHRDHVEPEMHIPPVLRNPEPFVDVLSAHDVPLMLTGHLHMPSTAKQAGVREVMAPTTCSFPQAYLILEVGPEGTTVRQVPCATQEELRYSFSERSGDSTTSRGLTAMAAVRCADFPLVDE
ncbi:MAG: metallophosphoesterase [Halodesulfurarchaeum sp.]